MWTWVLRMVWALMKWGSQKTGTPDEAVVGAAVGGVFGPAGVGGWDP